MRTPKSLVRGMCSIGGTTVSVWTSKNGAVMGCTSTYVLLGFAYNMFTISGSFFKMAGTFGKYHCLFYFVGVFISDWKKTFFG